MSSPTPLSAACNTFSLCLFKRLSDDNNTEIVWNKERRSGRSNAKKLMSLISGMFKKGENPGNVFYSPLGISSALATVLLGARGSTATQMAEVLHFEDDVHMDFSKLVGDLNKPGKSYALRLANRLYGEQSYRFVQEFLSATREHCDAQLEPVDFIGNAEEARLNINSWVEKQTQDKIKGLLAPGAVDGHTRLVLVNAVYFNAKWKEPFQTSRNGAKFRLSKTKSKRVKMMYQCNEFPFASIREVRCDILELPYMEEDLSMLIFLPKGMEDDTTGLERLEKELTYERFMDWTNPGKMRCTMVELGLPCFKMEATYDMKDILIKMGMVDAFDIIKSDFSGMSPANDMVLSKVVHKAFVEVNEEGTEAAAATEFEHGWVMCGSDGLPSFFFADHPFLFFIRHNPTMNILFAGRYCSPP